MTERRTLPWGMTVAFSRNVPERTLLIVDAGPDDCPYESGREKWESEVWLRCRARKALMVTNIGSITPHPVR